MWTQNRPERSGWYWMTTNPHGDRVGVYYWKEGTYGVITATIAQNKTVWFCGPIREPSVGKQ